ncbi:MAG: hypothetical protein HY548_03945 [Elusimicrobia bacterium]|nr:hypothetical protein [Elusimicrobiota bacterium]
MESLLQINWILLLGVVILFFTFFRMMRKMRKSAEAPRWVGETPLLPKDLAVVVMWIGQWRAQGRITEPEYERLMNLCREDADRQGTSHII